MGQYWAIFNVDKSVCIGSGDFSDFFLSGAGEADYIVKFLSSTGAKFPKDPLESQPYKEARKYRPSKTGLCDLPTELHDAIFTELRHSIDVFAFCLTASHFWKIGICHFKVLYTQYFRRAHDWRRGRLICLGDNSDDYPEGLISKERVEKLQAAYFHCFGDEGVDIYTLLSQFSNPLYEVKWPGAWDFEQRCALKKMNPLVIQEARKARKAGNTYEWGDDPYVPLYKYDFSAWFDLPDQLRDHELKRPCVLRNLSKKVYVRDDALLLTKENTNEGNEDDTNEDDEDEDLKPYYISFGSLVILRIAWSPDLSLGTPYDDDLGRGIWAGDRFDIVSLGAVEKEEGWTDVSTAAREQLIKVWKAVFGRQWQSEVREACL